jgi:Domain of unknown function (DUF4397)
MPKIFKYLAVFFALPLVLSGCKINSINYFPTTPTYFRVVNVLATTTPIDVTVNGAPTWTGLNFEAMTGYQQFVNTSTNITVSLSGSGTTLVQQLYNPAGNQNYTLVVFGTPSAPLLAVMADVTQPPVSGQFALNIFNAAPLGDGLSTSSASLDVYLSTPDTDLTTISPNFSYISYTTTNIFGLFNAGRYQLRLTIAGSKAVIYDSGPIDFADQTATDLIIYTRGSTILANVLLNQSDGAGQQVIANSKLARVKAVNSAFQSGPVNMLVNGTSTVPNLAVSTASFYNIVSSGAGTVTFEASSAPGSPIASLANSFAAATDQSIFVAGFAGSTSAVALLDNNIPPLSNNSSVRFVNSSPDSAPLDVFVNDVKLAAAISTYTASGYTQVSANTYTFVFKDSATGATVLTLPGVILESLQTYSMYVVGASGALTGFVTADTP